MGTEKATPFNYALGTLDDSIKSRSVLPKQYPQFLPVFFLNTQRGGYETNRVSGNLTDFIYGSETLNKLGKFINHAGVFASGILGAGGQVMIKRLPFVPPADNLNATGVANITLYVNISDPVTAKKYDRNADGTVKKSGDGKIIYANDDVTVRYINLSAKVDGSSTIVTEQGGMNIDDGAGGSIPVQVTSYPILTFKALAHGADYNNFGIAVTAMTGNNVINDLIANNEMGYALSLYYNDNGKTVLRKTETQAKYVTFSLKDNAIDPRTKKSNTIIDHFPVEYGFKASPDDKRTIYDFDNVIKYDSNIDAVLKLVAQQELSGNEGTQVAYADFNSLDANDTAEKTETLKALSNIFTATNSTGAPYEYVRVSNLISVSNSLVAATGKTITASLETPFFLEGGMDSDLDNTKFEEAVVREVARYSNPDDEVVDLAINPVSMFIDTGYSFATKTALGKFLGYRKDVMLIASTYTVDHEYVNDEKDKQPLSDAISVANLLKSSYKLYPESTLFGTETSRALIIMGSGKLSDGTYRKRLPLTYDFVIKMTRFMGAGNGKWNPVYRFSRQPGNIVNELVDIDPSHIPNTIKDKLWTSGIIWAQNEDRDTYFYPASQTIYTNDTSVLKAASVNVALCYIVKQEEAIWREFTGADDLSNINLKILAEDSLNKRLAGKFADSFKIIPEVFFTQQDLENGYSYKLVVHLYANNMKTVQESYTVVHRLVEFN